MKCLKPLHNGNYELRKSCGLDSLNADAGGSITNYTLRLHEFPLPENQGFGYLLFA
jgi:hypothetical protein